MLEPADAAGRNSALDPLWYEELPDNFWSWYEMIKAKSSDIVSLTIRVKRAQVSMDYLDIYGNPKRAKFYIKPDQNT